MRESKIERRLRLKVKRVGGEVIKIQGRGNRNRPDDVVLFPGAGMCFVETKATGKKPRSGQARYHARLWKLGFPVLILDSVDLVDSFVENFSKRLPPQ